MRPQLIDIDEADRDIRRIERQRFWRRLARVLGFVVVGVLAWWAIVEAGIWLARRLRGWL